jgi:hypothetical protein
MSAGGSTSAGGSIFTTGEDPFVACVTKEDGEDTFVSFVVYVTKEGGEDSFVVCVTEFTRALIGGHNWTITGIPLNLTT